MGDDSDSRRPRAARGTRKLSLEVAQEGPRWTCLGSRDPARLARQMATALAEGHNLPAHRAIATLVLASDARVRELNRQWRGQDKPTNVLSFPSAAPPPGVRPVAPRHLGDVFLAEETLAREARDLGIEAADHFRHLVLHGLLHLLGHDHETKAEAEAMEALETRMLAAVGVADPYAGTVAVEKPAARRLQPRRAARPR